MCARWCTSDPFDAIVAASDLVHLSLTFASLFLIVPSSIAPRIACGALVALASYAGIAGSPSRAGVASAAFVALGAVAAIGALARHDDSRARPRASLGPASFAIAVALALAFSLLAARVHPLFALALPFLLVALCVAAAPRAGASRAVAVVWLVAWVAASHVVSPLDPRRLASLPRAEARASNAGNAHGSSALLIVLDTLRRDRLSLYGYARPTTPAIDAWARGALVFDAAMSTSSWTLPSHASMFTGLYPRAHGTHAFRGTAPAGNAHALDERFDTLAEIAQRAGIATGGIAANHFYLSARFGLAQGFDSWFARAPRSGVDFGPLDALAELAIPRAVWRERRAYYEASHITDLAIDWLRAIGDERYFLFVNYFDVHEPTLRPPTPLAPLERERPLDEQRGEADRMLAGAPLDPDVARYWSNNYDRELERLDVEVARLLDFVARSGLLDRTLVVLTSDHGEYLGEHGLVGHELDLHREVVDVPLIVRGPGVAPGRTDRPTSLVDVAPTLLDYLGLEPPSVADADRGVSMLGGSASPLVAEWYPSAAAANIGPHTGGRFDRWIRVLRRGTLDYFADERGGRRLFDRASDPAQQRDVADERPGDVEMLGRALAAWEERNAPAHEHAPDIAPAPGEALDAEDLERLRELGYAP